MIKAPFPGAYLTLKPKFERLEKSKQNPVLAEKEFECVEFDSMGKYNSPHPIFSVNNYFLEGCEGNSFFTG